MRLNYSMHGKQFQDRIRYKLDFRRLYFSIIFTNLDSEPAQ